MKRGRNCTIIFFGILLSGGIVFAVATHTANAATGEVQFSISPAYQFGTAGSYLSNGNTFAKLFDGDLTTSWDAPAANGGYAGVDLTVPARVTGMLIAPRQGYTSRVFGVLVQAATTSSSTGPWTTLFTTPSYPPYYPARQYATYPINTSGQYYRYYRIVPPNGAYGSIAELRFIGVASSTTPYIPATPNISPAGGKFALPTLVSITSSTTDATIYYTIDGTTPTFSSGAPQGTTQLYTGQILASTTATTTVKAIAVSADTYVSDVSNPVNFYISPSFHQIVDWNDTDGRLIEGHDGGVSYLNGKYYWYGENLNNNANDLELLGIQSYSSPDLLNWKNEGLVVYTAGSYKLRRPHVIYNATTSQYVMWARNTTVGKSFIATSSSPLGPFAVVNQAYNNPGSYGNNDIDLFQDTNGTAYVVLTSNNSAKVIVYQLANDYLSATGTENNVTVAANRDAPVMFKRGSVYFLLSSGQNLWTASNVKYATSTSPLGTFSALVNPFQTAEEASTTGYNTIETDVIHVTGRTDGYIYAGDRFDSSAVATGSLYNSRFVWLPIVFPTNNTMTISWAPTWDLDTTFSSSALPAAATGLSAVKTSSSQVNLTWTNVEPAAYALYLDRASDGSFTQNVSSRVLVSGTTTYSDMTVSAGNVYFYRVRTVNGSGTSDSNTGIANYSLASDVTPPSVTLLAPSANAVIIGKDVLLSASSSDDIGVAEVRFYVSGNLVGTSTSTTPPNDLHWDSTTVTDGTRPLIVVAVDGSGNSATTSPINIIVSNNVPMLFVSTSTVFQHSTTTIALTGNATSWTPGTPGTPTFTISGGTGASIVSQVVSTATTSLIVIGAGRSAGILVITDPLSGATTSVAVASDVSAPVIVLTAPTNGSTLTGTTTLIASSTDNVAVASIQFKLDTTTSIGPASSTSPYSYAWSTVSTANGTHTILAVATDYSGNVSTTTIATVTVNNAGLPTVTTASPTGTSTFSVIFNGNISVDGGASTTVRGFNYGLTTAYTATTSESGTFNIGSFSTTTTGLSCGTTYHVRAFAMNLSGIAHGSDKTVTTLTCPIASAAGEVQFSVSAPYQFGLIPSYLNSGHVPANAFDGDVTTWWDTTAANGAYVGLDLTVPAQVTRMRIAPHMGYTVRVYGAVLQGSNATSSTVGPWTSIYTIPAFPPYYAQRQLTEIAINTGGATYRYYRLLMPNNTNGNLAELRLIGLPGTTTPYLPVPPIISPHGGRYDLPIKVRLSDITTDAAIYYTTDGTVPAFSGGAPQGTTQLYSGPFLVSNTATTTVRSIAVSQGTFVSELSDAAQFYISTDMKPAQDWLDTSGHLIESHDGGLSYFGGKYYWYGEIFNGNDPENEKVGISAYSSPDLINWKDEGPIIYSGRTDLIERPHVIYNDVTHKYVMWAHNIITYPNSRVYLAYSDTPSGPFTVSSTTLNPDGMGLNDMNLFKDTDGTAYVLYSNGNNTSFVISRLSSDYLSTSGTYVTPAVLVNHEAPAMMKRGSVYYLMVSGVTGWPPNLNKYSTSTSPLGPWSTPVSPFQPSSEQDVSTSYDSQVTDILTIAGKMDGYVYIGDRNDASNYQGGSLYNSRHIWLPMVFDAVGNMTISWQTNWNLNTAFPTSSLALPASGFTVNKTSSEVDLSWTNNATTSYTLFVDRATDGAFTQNLVSDLVASTTTSYTDTYDFNPSTTYYYRVRTLTGAGTSNTAVVSTVPSDTTPPTVSISVPVDSSSVATWSTSVSWGDSNACYYSIDNSSFVLSDCGSGTLSLATPSITSHVLVIKGVDIAGNSGYATSTFTYAPDLSVPAISAVSTTIGTSTFSVSWTTSKDASTLAYFGLTSSYGSSTGETNTSPRVTSHNVSISSLVPCTLYHYQLISIDVFAVVGSSTDNTFITSGCTGNSSVLSTDGESVTSASGGQMGVDTLTLHITAGFSASSSLVFQAKKLDSVAFFAGVSKPNGLNSIGIDIVNLKAFSDISTAVTTFLVPLRVVMSYTLSDISGIDESSLAIYRYDGSSWYELDNCQVDTTLHTVTCYTSNFSDFALFGTPAVVVPPPTPIPTPTPMSSTIFSNSSGGFVSLETLTKLLTPSAATTAYLDSIRLLRLGSPVTSTGNHTVTVDRADRSSQSNSQTTNDLYEWKRSLYLGRVGEDVRQLQIYLNGHGSIISVTGGGSPGHETTTFGAKTKLALISFQKKHGILPATGTFGPATTRYVKSH